MTNRQQHVYLAAMGVAILAGLLHSYALGAIAFGFIVALAVNMWPRRRGGRRKP